MALPVPNLDDRRFQDLVDDAKRRVQQRSPEWTDPNVSDPGVTLIETFAWMTDQVLYRLNRVPERNYIKFLELIGVRLFPPTAARAAFPCWLAGPQPGVIQIRPGTQAATLRTETDEAIVFTTIGDLAIVPCSLARVASTLGGEKEVSRSGPEPRPLPCAPRPMRRSSSPLSAILRSSPARSPGWPPPLGARKRSATTPRRWRHPPPSTASTRCRSRMTSSWSASPRPCLHAPSRCASNATSRA